MGRAADYVLRDRQDLVRVFIHAPKEFRIKRVMEVYKDTSEEARRNIRRSDKARAAYYKHVSGCRWGSKGANYELIIDSSLGIEKAADEIVSYVKNHFKDN